MPLILEVVEVRVIHSALKGLEGIVYYRRYIAGSIALGSAYN